MTYSIAVAGCTGYAGGEIVRLAAGHPEISIGALTAHSNAGTKLGAHLPNLPHLADRDVVDTTTDNLSGHDVVFLALPHGASARVAAELADDVLVMAPGPGRIVAHYQPAGAALARTDDLVYRCAAELQQHPRVRAAFELPGVGLAAECALGQWQEVGGSN